MTQAELTLFTGIWRNQTRVKSGGKMSQAVVKDFNGTPGDVCGACPGYNVLLIIGGD